MGFLVAQSLLPAETFPQFGGCREIAQMLLLPSKVVEFDDAVAVRRVGDPSPEFPHTPACCSPSPGAL